MDVFLLIVIAAVLMISAVYAQTHLSRYTAGSGKLMLTRAILVATGLAFGFVSAAVYAGDPVRAVLASLIGFGAVHFPAALILFIKQERREGKS
jgi:hypothetical protein